MTAFRLFAAAIMVGLTLTAAACALPGPRPSPRRRCRYRSPSSTLRWPEVPPRAATSGGRIF